MLTLVTTSPSVSILIFKGGVKLCPRPQGDEFLNLVVCDVSGHGVGSTLMANRTYSETLHALELRTGPSTLLRQLRDFVQDRIAVDGFYFNDGGSAEGLEDPSP
jgi:Stage II sporulation protein E (SpoIIE)